MPYEFYKVLHLSSILLLFLSLGGYFFRSSKTEDYQDGISIPRKLLIISHGIASFLILLSGFGLAARLGYVQVGLPGWIHGKLLIWLILGGIIVVIRKKIEKAFLIWPLVITLGIAAAILAVYKPFN